MGQYDQVQTKAQASPDAGASAESDRGTKARPISGAQADKMFGSLTGNAATTRSARLSPSDARHDFGEQVVGSHDAARVRAPWNLSDQEAVARFSVRGDGFALISSPTMTLPPSRTMGGPDLDYAELASPIVAYRPTRPGRHDGTLMVSVGWNLDGHTETRTVELHGRARTLEQAPSHEMTAEEIVDDAAHAKRHTQEAADDERAMAAEKKHPGPYNDEFNTAVHLAGIAAAGLARAQSRGLAIIKDETVAYHKLVEKAPRSIWWDLAEIALTVATAGVASHVAKNLLPRLMGSEFVRELPGGIRKTELIPAKFSEFTTDAIKESIKQAGKKAIQTLGPGADGQHAAAPSHAAFAHSSNAQIDFFAHQKKILDTQERENSESLLVRAQHLRPLLHNNPDQAVAVMRQVKEQFDASAEDAEQQQANAVAPSWATFVARMSLGAETVTTARSTDVPQQAVQTAALRSAKLDGAPRVVDGVLDVYVENTRPPPRVSGAVLHGTSQSVVDRIGELVLSDVKMPVRLVLGPRDASPAIVTRDEAGRVRVEGAEREADAVKSATEMVDQILSRSLASWGVKIKSDDVAARHD